MERREFLKGMIGVLTGLVGAVEGGLEREVTNANEILRIFPEKIDGAGKIVKYEDEGASQLILNVKQSHYLDMDMENVEEKNREMVYRIVNGSANRTQGDVFKILNKLVGMGQKNLFYEGSVRDMTRLDCVNNYDEIIREIRETGYFSGEFERGEFEKYGFIPGAGLMFGGMGKVNVLRTESKELMRKAGEDGSKENHEAREDYVLDRIREKGLTVSPLVFGARHSFVDNIKKHDGKFSLIEIFPASYGGKDGK